MKKTRNVYWKKYTLEFLSVFIAVISAFALSKWNENRNSSLSQDKILLEIHNGLSKDLEDVQVNVMGHQVGLRAIEYFREALSEEASNDEDSIMIQYFRLTRDFVSIQNTSGYETLKSKGLELIKNDSLRIKIISLYEYDYNILRKLEEDYSELQFQENYFNKINDMIVSHFKFDENKKPVGFQFPLILEENDEKAFLMYLWKMEINRNFVLNQYDLIENNIQDLQKEIEITLR